MSSFHSGMIRFLQFRFFPNSPILLNFLFLLCLVHFHPHFRFPMHSSYDHLRKLPDFVPCLRSILPAVPHSHSRSQISPHTPLSACCHFFCSPDKKPYPHPPSTPEENPAPHHPRSAPRNFHRNPSMRPHTTHVRDTAPPRRPPPTRSTARHTGSS